MSLRRVELPPRTPIVPSEIYDRCSGIFGAFLCFFATFAAVKKESEVIDLDHIEGNKDIICQKVHILLIVNR